MAQLKAICNNCQTQIGSFQLHKLRDHGDIHTLCTFCVLKLNREFFCPVCFQVHVSSTHTNAASTSSNAPSDDQLMCSQCPSLTHSSCAKFNIEIDLNASPLYICPICSDPNWFNPNNPIIVDRRFNLIDGSVKSFVVDEVKANGVIAAGKIVEMKMRMGADLAQAEAEKKAAIAVEAKNKAKEVLKHAMLLPKKVRTGKKGRGKAGRRKKKNGKRGHRRAS